MDRSFVEAIVQNSRPEFKEDYGITFSNEKFTPILPPQAEPLFVHSLSAVIAFCEAETDADKSYTLNVISPEKVCLYSHLNEETRQREALLISEVQGESFDFDSNLSSERFIIGLQALFVQDENTAAILKMVGNIKSRAESCVEDDGVTQSVSVRAGLVKEEMKAVPNPVQLAPYRTFREVEQPASRFVLRVNTDGPSAALYEADGGAWRDEATQNIKQFLVNGLKSAGIGNVTVIA